MSGRRTYKSIQWVLLEPAKIVVDGTQFGANRNTLLRLQCIPDPLQRFSMYNFHVNKSLVSIHTPPVYLRNWDVSSKEFPNSIEALGF